jgi:hypothetical protein
VGQAPKLMGDYQIYFQNKTKFQGLGILPTSAEKAPHFQQYISQGL